MTTPNPNRAPYVCMMVGFTLGNFIWQAVTVMDWERAADRSYFQGIVLLMAWWITRPRRWMEG